MGETTLTKVSPMVEAGYQTIKSQVKDATPKLLEETKDNVSSYITAATDYTASFSLAHLGLKLVDAGLTALEGILTKVGSDQDSLLVSGVRKVHSTANTIRLSALKKAGT